MGRGVAFLCLIAGGVICAAAFGYLPAEYVAIEAPRWLLGGAGGALILAAFMSLARDHRISDTLLSILLLAIAAGSGWLTFYAPAGTVERLVPFIPATVTESLGRLLFGMGAAVCVGMAALALRRLFR